MKIQCIKKWVISIVGFAIMWTAWNALACVATAFAEPAVAGDWHPAQPAAIGDSAVTWLLAGLFILKVLEMGLTWLAPRTKTTLDDRALDAVHTTRGIAAAILEHLRPSPPPDPPPGPLPAIVSGTITTKDGTP